ncbi:MAG: type II secretion system F family protein [Ethanoligenens sp.]
MPAFQYVAKDLKGNAFKGIVEADTLDGFYRILKERGQFCIDVSPMRTAKDIELLGGRKLNLKVLSIFCRQFSTMLEAGLPILKILDVLYEQAENKRLKAVILGVYEAVQHGESLSRAMAAQEGAFPLLMRHMVEAGEAGGTLDAAMQRLADQYEKENKLHNKVQQALIYPVFLSIMSIGVVAMLLTFVMPTFLSLYTQSGSSLPPTTRILLGLSTVFTKYWYLLLVIAVAIVILARTGLKNPKVRLTWDTIKLRLPIIGKLMLVVESAQFARTLSSLFNGGLPIIQSLEIVEHVMGNHLLKRGLRKVREDVRRGTPISVSVHKLNIFPPMLCSMLNVGEESGNMDEILEKTAAFYDEEAEAAIQRMVSLLEPIMIIVLAVIVGFIVISIITPIYSLYGQLSNSNGAGLK